MTNPVQSGDLGASAKSTDTHRVAETPVVSGHTPGPWSLRPTPTNFTIDAPDGIRVTSLSWQPLGLRIPHAGKVEAEANARLIAAAPDLLEAAREGLICAEADIEAQQSLNDEYGDPDDADPILDVFIARRDQIAAAIAKATGETK